MLNSDYVSPDKSDPHACNNSDLADGYILNILDLNIPKSDSYQCQNALEQLLKRDPNGEGLSTDVCVSLFAINDLYETTTNTNYYNQVAFHKLAPIKLFDKNPNDAMISIVFDNFIATLCDYEYAGYNT